MKHNLPDVDKVMGGNYKGSPIAHYPNWSFMCPDCNPRDSFYELPQELEDIQEAYKAQTLKFLRPCGCITDTVHPETVRVSIIGAGLI